MERLLKQALLYDFYGELLTEHQKSVYEDFVLNDYSLSEIGEARHISRQGVYDIVRRCEKQLNGYEEKLHLVEKFLSIRDKANRIEQILGECEREKRDPGEIVARIREITDAIIEEL